MRVSEAYCVCVCLLISSVEFNLLFIANAKHTDVGPHHESDTIEKITAVNAIVAETYVRLEAPHVTTCRIIALSELNSYLIHPLI